jgi:hypothetical protein
MRPVQHLRGGGHDSGDSVNMQRGQEPVGLVLACTAVRPGQGAREGHEVRQCSSVQLQSLRPTLLQALLSGNGCRQQVQSSLGLHQGLRNGLHNVQVIRKAVQKVA